MEIKAISQGFKDVDIKKGIVTGYLANFNTKDHDGDIILPGSFTKTVQENGPQGTKFIKYLLDHKKDKVVGVFTELKEDKIGLPYEAKLGRHAAGQDYALMVEDGIINQHSFGFKRLKQEIKSDAKYIQEVKMFEGSGLQFWAANGNTPITGIKDMEDIIERLQLLNKAMKDGKYSDDAFIELAQEIIILNETVKSLDAIKAGTTTLEVNEPNVYQLFINSLKKVS